MKVASMTSPNAARPWPADGRFQTANAQKQKACFRPEAEVRRVDERVSVWVVPLR